MPSSLFDVVVHLDPLRLPLRTPLSTVVVNQLLHSTDLFSRDYFVSLRQPPAAILQNYDSIMLQFLLSIAHIVLPSFTERSSIDHSLHLIITQLRLENPH